MSIICQRSEINRKVKNSRFSNYYILDAYEAEKQRLPFLIDPSFKNLHPTFCFGTPTIVFLYG